MIPAGIILPCTVPREAGDGFGIPGRSGLNSPIPPELAALGMSPIPKNSQRIHQIPHFALSPILPSLPFPVKVSVPPPVQILRDRSRNLRMQPCSHPKSPRNSWDSRKIQTNRGSKSLGTTSRTQIPQDAPPKTSLLVTSIPREWG